MTISLSDIGWQAHPEVWLLVVAIGAFAYYITRVLGPKAVAAGYEPISRRQKVWFGLALAGLWLASDWPVHDVAEEYLYFVHMGQHLFISMLVPAMFLLALPRWLFDLLLPKGSAAYRVLAVGSRPVVAGVLFNALTVALHWTTLVQASFDSAALHFVLHLVVFTAGLLMWMPVLSPERQWRLTPVGQCMYLFMMSIVPTVPGGWLVFAEDVVYRHYDIQERLWGIGVLSDQQAAGVVMKLVGGFFLWAVIVTIFSRWASAESVRDQAARRARSRARYREAVAAGTVSDDGAVDLRADDSLLYDEVTRAFDETEAPVEDQTRPSIEP